MTTSAMVGGSEAALEDGYVNDSSPMNEDYDPSADPENDQFWVQRARSSFQSSQTWFDTSIRRRMEYSMRLFNSDHPRGSRYR